MEVWYAKSVCHKGSNAIPLSFAKWVDKNVTRVFLHSSTIDVESYLETKEITRYFDKELPDGLQFGDAFLHSYLLSKTILNVLPEVQTIPSNIVIIIEQDGVLPYFLMQQKWTLHSKLRDIQIITVHNETHLKSSEYRFPQYWIKQIEQQCLGYSDTSLIWDKEVWDVIQQQNGVRNAKYISLDTPGNFDWNKELKIGVNEFGSENQIDFPFHFAIPLKTSSHFENEKKSLSIIIPYYNLGDLIIETIESILLSTYSDIEVIVVNDGSNDVESIDILRIISSKYNNLNIVNIENRGLANARNIGAKVAKGKYIAFLDADDKVDPNYYERCVKILERYKNISFVHSWVQYFGLKNDIWVTYNTAFPYLLLSNMLSAFAVIRREDF